MPDYEKLIPKLRGLSGEPSQQHQSAIPDSSAVALPVEKDPFYPAFWQNVIEASSFVPQGDEPAYWPIHLLHELDDLVTYRSSAAYSPGKAALADKLAPIKESIRNIKLAYSIIAYPHCRLSQPSISVRVSHDRRIRQLEGVPKDHIQLNDTEMTILRQLCETPRFTHAERDDNGCFYPQPTKTIHPPLAFDPKRRVFRYSEVPSSPF